MTAEVRLPGRASVIHFWDCHTLTTLCVASESQSTIREHDTRGKLVWLSVGKIKSKICSPPNPKPSPKASGCGFPWNWDSRNPAWLTSLPTQCAQGRRVGALEECVGGKWKWKLVFVHRYDSSWQEGGRVLLLPGLVLLLESEVNASVDLGDSRIWRLCTRCALTLVATPAKMRIPPFIPAAGLAESRRISPRSWSAVIGSLPVTFQLS